MRGSPPQELSSLLRAWSNGDESALVNEAYLRLIDAHKVEWQDRAHFFAIAAKLMRRILVDFARMRGYQKRGERVFSADALKCDRCGARMRIVCVTHPAGAIRKILDCLGLPSKPPPISPVDWERNSGEFLN